MDIEKSLRKRNTIRTLVTNIVQEAEELLTNSELDIDLLEELLVKLKQKECQLKEINDQVEKLIDVSSIETEILDSEEFNDKISKCIRKINRKLKPNIVKNPESQREIEAKDRGFNVKLPKLTIEKFTGNPQEWTEFWNSFETTIHENNVLSKVEKFSYLKMYLSGKALNVVSGFELSSENYDNCIKILKDRFGRKDVIVSSYMNKIINIEPVKNSSNLNALRRLYDDLITSVRNLDAMSVTSGSYSCMLIPMVLKKIPYNMVLEFNRKKGSKSEVEVSELLDYIKSEIECRESSNLIINGNLSELASSPRNSFESKKYVHTKRPVAATLATNVKVRYCCFCKNDAHDSDNCNEFSNEQKRNKLRDDRRCYRCLKKFHTSSTCRSKIAPCSVCKKNSHNKIFCKSVNEKVEVSEEGNLATAMSVNSLNSRNVLLQTCTVSVLGESSTELTRLLTDSAAERNFIRSDLVKKLKLKSIRKETLYIYSFGMKIPQRIVYDVVDVRIQSLENPKNSLQFEALVTDTITGSQINFADKVTRSSLEKRDLLWKSEFDTRLLGSNFTVALKRLESLIPKLEKNKWLHQCYDSVLKEQLDLGVIEPCSLIDQNQNSYYMPHRPVVKEGSETTKVRIVFDASSKQGNFYSLNDCLMPGPNLNPSILDLLINFRKHKIAFSADIEKAFLQIGIKENERDFLRFLYFDKNNDNELKCFRMTRVPFGVTCSPFILAATIKHHIKKFKGNSEVHEMLDSSVYVDDLFYGGDSLEKAHQLSTDAVNVFREAGMNLRKFQTNSTELKKIWVENNVTSETENDNRKILGLIWNVNTDTLKLEIDGLLEMIPNLKCTKRHILKTVAKVFDPVGFISPFVIRVKCLLQQLWELGLDFDDAVPQRVRQNWLEWCAEVETLKSFSLKRTLFSNYDVDEMEIHVFADSSTKAYGAVAYIRHKRTFEVQFVLSKTRVAPVKKLTLPRLELLGALIAARIASYLKSLLRISACDTYCWTDSSIALNWIKGSAIRWKQFVANRVREIQTLTDPGKWKFCEGRENPADLLSRGCSAQKLLNSEIWWSGTRWLSQPKYLWPATVERKIPEEITELKGVKTVVQNITVQKPEHPFHCLFNKCSSWSKVVRVAAWCLRFIKNLQKTNDKTKTFLLTSEFEEAQNVILKSVQEEAFHEEIQRLKINKPIKTRSKLLALCPYLDGNEILRVGGRLRHAKLHENTKYPVILPKDHVVTDLIIRHYHLKYLHAGNQLVHSAIRQRYWILCARVAIKRIIWKCVRCARLRSALSQQLMGDLPPSRVNPSRAFSKVGVDLSGPFQVKPRKGRGIRPMKTYACIFVCFTVKAVHLEMLGDLSSDCFIAALKRFAARRGKPDEIFSDCGTNFIGASKELKAVCSTESVANFLCTNEIVWHFNPPSAPHFGGLWEAAVKSMKFHLRRAIGAQILIYEEFSTLLVQIEACLNSRPLVPVSSDPDDLSVITPANFLIGSTLDAIPERDVTNFTIPLADRWKLVQQISQSFWKRWSSEYITQFQRRSKWQRPHYNLRVNDIVLIKDDNLPPLKWRMGRVVETFPGSDNQVRVVKLKTQLGVMKRPIHKLCVLPVES
ncbi:hypothetical protein AVEN_150654-1 [Araneus ventricosus]|uniref:Integrase catalytic domain-containing protein n=1 Tax=Araneus ventricosus TaxID=182803 RepID=A0A4Y2DUZ1_ARAVE|nr:hypothetical protein AVEN_26036-1 [Araneus ventricosus]GBM20703.1 hypothetical protein AVEN_150654-1 [Araneus ventricosus]